ncbi:carbohydrate ABC transporter permease [Nonomuraea gerenzanensis]|uniref:Maltose/maltodextrin ABC transporter, permease protein MalF n=1 Tax=Nonomuraea gerenzanensis TaxID=93944 RepID=A0A1M4E366_9ACTN|nr:sugar ABC transporter permease [Nonomuraea gerenzanensis]UBU15443.1 sugar ABC transporter permease [Nonomuraea gerenzanensis]SBO93200.1 Maltose/maltodextrin ABC transporter, permease protein MalF [Nonomuraea gerenzanensis]
MTPRSSRWAAAALLSPTLLVLALVVFYPLVAAMRESFYESGQRLDADGFVVEGEWFAGLANYAGVVQQRFLNAAFNTTLFTVVTVSLEVVLGVAMALVMRRAFRGRALLRASILIPWAVPTAVAGLMWKWIFQADGVANALLGTEILWTADGPWAKLAVIVADTWKTAPFVGLLVLAGLQIIPAEVYEAAKVDGATPWQTFWRVTLPLVKPALLVAVLFRLMDALRIFDLPYVLVGPRKQSVETLSGLIWDEATRVHYGPASAYGTALFCYIAVIAFVFVKLLGADLLSDVRARRREGSARVG